MKALVIIAVVAGGLFLLVRSSSFSFYAYSVTTSANGTSELHCYTGCNTDVVQQAAVENGSDPSPMVRDALALVAADQDPGVHASDRRDAASLTQTRAAHGSPVGGDAVLDQERRSSSPRWTSASPPSSAASVPSTSSRRRARRVAKRRFERSRVEQGAVRELEISLAQSRPEWSVVSRFYADECVNGEVVRRRPHAVHRRRAARRIRRDSPSSWSTSRRGRRRRSVDDEGGDLRRRMRRWSS